jgi:lysophospholipase L1-like esterase
MTDWEIKVHNFMCLNKLVKKGEIVFTGSSLCELFPINEMLQNVEPRIRVYNRGIGGFVTDELLTNLAVCILDLAPRMLFLNIGTNDLSDASRPMAQIMGTYRAILEKVLQALPNVQIYLMAYYPINEEAATPEMKPCLRVRTNEKIAQANAEVQKLAKTLHLHYIDVNAPLKDEQGRLRAEFTYEGMHIRPEGYRTIYPAIKKILMNA